MITINADEWSEYFEITSIDVMGDTSFGINEICNKMYKLFIENPVYTSKKILTHITKKEFSDDDKKNVSEIFGKKGKPKIHKIIEGGTKNNLPDGIERKKVDKKDEKSPDEKSPDEDLSDDEIDEDSKKYTPDVIVRMVIPIISFLTMKNTKEHSFNGMCEIVKNEPKKYKVMCDRIITWWRNGKNKDTNIESVDKIFEFILKTYEKYYLNDDETNKTCSILKELYSSNRKNSRVLSKLIDEHMNPIEVERKQNAEISTPRKLRQEMLNVVPIDFWKGTMVRTDETKIDPKNGKTKKVVKIFEPCCGKGGFLVDIVERLMIGLIDVEHDEQKRHKLIVEHCLYFSDINVTNIYICTSILDPDDEYKLNFNEGDTLKLDVFDKWKVNGFDLVVGNPPYNSHGRTGTGNTIWQLFTRKALEKWIKQNGYLLFVHPPGWRKPENDKSKYVGMFNLMTHENKMLYLEIHNVKDGIKTFQCGTRYDWFLICKNTDDIHKYKTIISDENRTKYKINMSKWKWLPNYNFENVKKILCKKNDKPCEVIYSANIYDTRRVWVNKIKNDKFKYTLIHSTPKSGIRYMYTNDNTKGHFGISKVIFGQAGINDVVIDMKGKYGLTDNAIGIKIINMKDACQLKNVLMNVKFNNIIKSCSFGNFRIDWRLFTMFKQNFWQEFL